MLQEELVYATEEVVRLTKVLDEQYSLLQASQLQTAQKDITIQNLQQKVKFMSIGRKYSTKTSKVKKNREDISYEKLLI